MADLKGIGGILDGLGSLYGAYASHQAAKDANAMAQRNYNLALSQYNRGIAKEDRAQKAFEKGFADSGLAQYDPTKKRYVNGLGQITYPGLEVGPTANKAQALDGPAPYLGTPMAAAYNTNQDGTMSLAQQEEEAMKKANSLTGLGMIPSMTAGG